MSGSCEIYRLKHSVPSSTFQKIVRIVVFVYIINICIIQFEPLYHRIKNTKMMLEYMHLPKCSFVLNDSERPNKTPPLSEGCLPLVPPARVCGAGSLF